MKYSFARTRLSIAEGTYAYIRVGTWYLVLIAFSFLPGGLDPPTRKQTVRQNKKKQKTKTEGKKKKQRRKK